MSGVIPKPKLVPGWRDASSRSEEREVMKFLEPLEEGVFLKRYKRFFADVQTSMETLVAHVPNTGSLKGCLEKGSACRFSLSTDPKRKLKATLQMIQTPTTWVGVNTGISNKLVWEAFENHQIPSWEEFEAGQPEVKINDGCRLDFAFWRTFEGPKPGEKLTTKNLKDYRLHFVEVKNITLAEDGVALFPDAVTERGQKHIEELMKLMKKGHSAEILFTVQRTDCKEFRPADAIDPRYGKLLRKAYEQGLKVSAYPCVFNKNEIVLDGRRSLKVNLD